MYKVEVQTDDSKKWYGNALKFETIPEAERYANDLQWRWILVREWRVVKTES